MGTRSTISVYNKDGVIKSVYCHWDGYYEHNGVILYNFYNTISKVNKLIDCGDISSLGTEIGKKHKFIDIYHGCTFYHRDRGEDKNITVINVEDVKNPYCNIPEEEYNYIFLEETGEWIAKKEGEGKYQKLEDILRKISLSVWMIPVSNEKQYEKMADFYTTYGNHIKIPNIEEVLYEV